MTTPSQRPTFLQAITIAGAGLLIALFGCLGALAGFGNGNSTSTLTEIGIAGFVLGILMFVVGGVLLLVVIIRPFLSRNRAGVPPVTPPGPTSGAAGVSGPPEGE